MLDGGTPVGEEREADENGVEDADVADEEGIVIAPHGIQQQQRTAIVYKACMLRNVNICIKKVQCHSRDEEHQKSMGENGVVTGEG